MDWIIPIINWIFSGYNIVYIVLGVIAGWFLYVKNKDEDDEL